MSNNQAIEKINNKVEDLQKKRQLISDGLERNEEKIQYHEREIQKLNNQLREMQKLTLQLSEFQKNYKQLQTYRTIEQRKSFKLDSEIKRLQNDAERLRRKENRKMIQ